MVTHSVACETIGNLNLGNVELRLVGFVRIQQQAEAIARDMTEVHERLTDRNSSHALALKNLHEFLASQESQLDGKITEGHVSRPLFRVDACHLTRLHESLRHRNLSDRGILRLHELECFPNVARVDFA